jgi:hypothetical protein
MKRNVKKLVFLEEHITQLGAACVDEWHDGEVMQLFYVS